MLSLNHIAHQQCVSGLWIARSSPAAGFALVPIPIAYEAREEHVAGTLGVRLSAELQARTQALGDTEFQLKEVASQSRQLQSALAQARSRTGREKRGGSGRTGWTEDAAYVQVPEAILAAIKIPSIGNDGLLTEDMARALELNEQQVSSANQALANFSAQYRQLEAAHSHPTQEHPTSMHISPVLDQKTFVCEGFPDDYQHLLESDTLRHLLTVQTNCARLAAQGRADNRWKNVLARKANKRRRNSRSARLRTGASINGTRQATALDAHFSQLSAQDREWLKGHATQWKRMAKAGGCMRSKFRRCCQEYSSIFGLTKAFSGYRTRVGLVKGHSQY